MGATPLLRCVAVVVVLIAGAPPSSGARTRADLSGRYVLVDAERRKSEVLQAVDAATEDMSFLKELARTRLYETSLPLPEIELRFPEKQIQVRYRGESPIVTPDDGTPVKWTSRFGDSTRVVQTFADGVLTQRFRGTLGSSRTNVYSLSADGKGLIVTSVIQSAFIPEPIEFEVFYARR